MFQKCSRRPFFLLLYFHSFRFISIRHTRDEHTYTLCVEVLHYISSNMMKNCNNNKQYKHKTHFSWYWYFTPLQVSFFSFSFSCIKCAHKHNDHFKWNQQRIPLTSQTSSQNWLNFFHSFDSCAVFLVSSLLHRLLISLLYEMQCIQNRINLYHYPWAMTKNIMLYLHIVKEGIHWSHVILLQVSSE